MQATAAFVILCAAFAVSSAAQPVRPETLAVPGAAPDTKTISSTDLASLAIAEPDIVVPAEIDSSAPMNLVGVKLLLSREGDVRAAIAFAGTPDLRQVALAGVRHWKFRPYLVDGEPREVQSAMFLTFHGRVGKSLIAPRPATAGIVGGAPGVYPPVPPRPQGPVRVSTGTVAGLLLEKVDPLYPPEARAAHAEGMVVLHAILSKQGTVQTLQVVSGPPMLTQAAVDAVQRWRYKPYLLNGEPVEVETTININFTILHPSPSDTAAPDPESPASLPPLTITQMLVDSPMPHCLVDPTKPAPAVVLHIVIAKDGSVKDVELTSGPPELQACTLEAVRRWRFRPAVYNGQAKEAEGTVSMHILPGID